MSDGCVFLAGSLTAGIGFSVLALIWNGKRRRRKEQLIKPSKRTVIGCLFGSHWDV